MPVDVHLGYALHGHSVECRPWGSSSSFIQPRPQRLLRKPRRVDVSASSLSLFARRRVQRTARDEEEPGGEVYDPRKLQEYFNRRPHRVLARAAQLALAGLAWFVEETVSRDPERKTPARRAERARGIISELGPAYIKIGQALSCRPDIFPEEVLLELAKLQDNIPPFDSAEAMRVMEQEMNASIDDIFCELTADPVATASIGQVYRGRLKADGVEVAVKVQRPNIRAELALDVWILRKIAQILQKVYKTNTDLTALVDEWASTLYKELDYRLEASNGEQFREQLRDVQEVLVPRTYCNLSTERVLIIEWVDGKKLSNLKTDRAAAKRLVEVGVYCSLAQLLDQGFYHADPHPGNLLMTHDGRLAYLDFGMMGHLDKDLRRGLLSAMVHLVNKEFTELANDMVELGMLPSDVDEKRVVPALTGKLKVFMNEEDTTLSDISFSNLSVSLSNTMYQYKFRIPSYYTLIIRSLAILEGIALQGDPDFKVLRSAYPWVARRLLTDTEPAIQKNLINVLYKEGVFQYQRLENLLLQAGKKYVTDHSPSKEKRKSSSADRPSRHIANATMSEDVEMMANALSFILSDDGQFLLEVLLTETVRGMESMSKVRLANAVKGRLPMPVDLFEAGVTKEDEERVASIAHLVTSLATGVIGIGPSSPLPAEPQPRGSFTDRFRDPARAALLQASYPYQPSPSSNLSAADDAARNAEMMRTMQEVIDNLSPETKQRALQLPMRLIEKITARAAATAVPRMP